MVYLSVALAMVVSHAFLSLASRATGAQGRARAIWLIGGMIATGIGLWSIHLIVLLSLQLPIALTYDIATGVVALWIAVVTCGATLALVSGIRVTPFKLFLGAMVASVGVCGLAHTGISSIRVAPEVVYEDALIATSVGVAFASALAAFLIAFTLPLERGWQRSLVRILAAIVMGSGIAGVQYLSLAAAHFDATAHALPGTTIENGWFAIAVVLFALGVTGITMLTVLYDEYLARHLRDRDFAREQAHANARYAAHHDTLTNLPNRLAIAKVAEAAIEEAAREGSQFALMMMNVDRLKTINDSLGHEAGDELLRELSQRLRSVLRRSDKLARLAGDEFAILARNVDGPDGAEAVVVKIQEALQQPFFASSLELHTSLSIGISMYPNDGESFEALLRRADVAMRASKEVALGGYRFYAPEMSNVADDRLALETDLRRALDQEQLELHYQPKVDIGTGRVRSAEALIRWRHPTRGNVAPGVFIPLAEETGLIVPIGEWVLRAACRQLREWIDQGMPPVRVAINLSAKQFRQANLPEVVKAALEESNLQPGYLELELTESAVMHDAEKSAEMLQTLSTMGVHISIDDFGTGYSSLSYLRRFPLDKLKIDRSFIRDLMQNPDDVSIVRAIISLAHSLRLRVVAEGVETADQLEFLRNLGCDQYQGFYYSPAVPAEAFAELIRRLRSERTEYTEADMLKTQSRLSAYTPT